MLAVLSIANYFLYTLLTILISRWMGTAVLGYFLFTVSIANISLVITSLGKNKAVLNELTQLIKAQKSATEKTYIHFHLWAIPAFSLLLCVGALVIFAILDLRFSIIKSNLLLGICYYTFIMTVTILTCRILLVYGYKGFSIAIDRIIVPGISLTLLTLLFFTYHKINLNDLLIIYGISWTICFFLSLIMYFFKIEKLNKSIKKKDTQERWLFSGSKYMIATLLFLIYHNAGIIILIIVFNSAHDAGVYSTLFYIVKVIYIFQIISSAVIATKLSKIKQFNKLKGMQMAFNKIIAYYKKVAIAFFLLIAALGYTILSWYGIPYSNELFIGLLLMVGGNCLFLVYGFGGYVLQYYDLKKHLYKNYGIMLGLSIIMNLVLIPYLGVLGASIAFFLPMLVMVKLQSHTIFKNLQLKL